MPKVVPQLVANTGVRGLARVLHEPERWVLELAWSEDVNAELLEALARLPMQRLFGGPGPHGARPRYWMPAVIHTGGHRRQLERLLSGARQLLTNWS